MITSDVHVAAVVKSVAEEDESFRHLGSFLRLSKFCADAARLGLIEYSGDIWACRITERGRDLYLRLLRQLPEGRANAWVGPVMTEISWELERLDREMES
ncbi:hypothetical protein [Saccharopolyspora taberi]|uniref:MarR family transcriptional regulator n=1 Tax=Saccharopolyspora taberi TaxID=60895 RepID=A0ABN3V0F3_9PSEU